jgi:nucleotide-binding universal stress UspA family protein
MNHIVVGVDGSRAAAAALRWAAGEARRTGADLVAVHAWLPGPSGVREPRAGEQRTVAWAVDALDPVPEDLRVRVEVRTGRPVAVLLAAARRARLLVIGYDDETARRPRSTARRCRQAARCEVVVVRASDGTPDSLLGVPA